MKPLQSLIFKIDKCKIYSCLSVSIPVCILYLLCTGCTPGYKEEAAIRDNVSNLEILMTKMDSLSSVGDSLWQDVTQTLEKELPANLSDDERRNMLQLKNANLISMFQVFSSLDTPLQKKVMAAGEKDKALAAEIRNIMFIIEGEKKNYISSRSS